MVSCPHKDEYFRKLFYIYIEREGEYTRYTKGMRTMGAR